MKIIMSGAKIKMSGHFSFLSDYMSDVKKKLFTLFTLNEFNAVCSKECESLQWQCWI